MTAATGLDAPRLGTGGGADAGGRIQSIHLLRALAAIVVVWAHLGPYFLASADRGWVGVTFWRRTFADPLHLFQDGGHLGVVIFFLVSGYIITHVSLRETRTSFAVRRVFRIFPALLLAVLVAAGAQALASSAGLMTLPGLHGDGLRSYVLTFLLSNWWSGAPYAISVTWTLQVELMFYLLTAILLTATHRRPLASTWWMAGIWALATALVLGLPWAYRIEHYTVYVAFLIIGRLVYLVHTGRVRGRDSVTLFAAVALVFTLFHTKGFPGVLLNEQHEAGASYVIAVVVFLACLQLAPRRLPAPLRFVGDISYSLYLLHMPIGMLSLAWLTSVGVPYTAALVLALVIVVGASWASYRVVEVPNQRLARRLTTTKVSPPVEVSAPPVDGAPSGGRALSTTSHPRQH